MNYPNLKTVEITRTVQITPEDYYEYCKRCKETPTETGYVEYYSDEENLNGCFTYSDHYVSKINTNIVLRNTVKKLEIVLYVITLCLIFIFAFNQ